jgi:hypothetical protein
VSAPQSDTHSIDFDFISCFCLTVFPFPLLMEIDGIPLGRQTQPPAPLSATFRARPESIRLAMSNNFRLGFPLELPMVRTGASFGLLSIYLFGLRRRSSDSSAL